MIARWVPWVVLVGVVVGVAGVAVLVADLPLAPGEDLVPSTGTATIQLDQELSRLEATPGEISIVHRYDVPSAVADLTASVPEGATVTATRGFVGRGPNEYAWDGDTEDPSISYRYAVNRTRDARGPIRARGDYVYVDVGDWALTRVPPGSTSWEWRGPEEVELERSVRTAGPGAAGDTIAFLGEHDAHERTVDGQRLRLVVPEAASMAETPTSVLESMAGASETVRVGDRDDRVFVVAAPTDRVEWGVRGLQTGPADAWVRDVEELDTADNVWLHEYVHTRQDYAADADARWFTEGAASYYAALLTLERGRIDFAAFRDRLALGTREVDGRAILADPSTWGEDAPYTKGALVAGELDRRVRLATDREATLQTVFRDLNEEPGTITGATIVDRGRVAGGDAVASAATNYTRTRETPPTWEREDHEAAFGSAPSSTPTA